MKLSKWFKSILALCSCLLFSFCSCATLTLPDRDSLRLRILEFDRESGKLVQVLTSRNSDIVYGEDVSQGGEITVECRSSYGPVTFAYKGDGNPQYVTNTNTTRTAHTVYYWTFISFTGIPRAEDSGNYTCITVPDPSIQNSVHLYVPDSSQSVFVPSRLASRLEYPKSNQFRLPCAVVHPAARVSLERVTSDHQRVIDNADQITYSPKTGFYIPVSLVNLKGFTTFLCKASFRGKVDEAEFKIFSELPPLEKIADAEFFNQISTQRPATRPQFSGGGLRSACSKSTCGRFAECIVIDYAAHCVCFENFSGDPWTACYQIGEQLQQYTVGDPCSPNPCGRNNPCIAINGHPVCTCQGNHEGIPTVCKPQKSAPISIPKTSSVCRSDNECAWEEYCNQRSGVCENVCNGTTPFCGVNAHCSVNRSRRPVCDCLEGFSGQAKVACHKIQHNRPENSTLKFDNQKQLCNRTRCGAGAKCRVQNGNVQCFCPNGTQVNPDVQCSSLPTTVPQADLAAITACNNCGPNSVCTVIESKVFCECAPNSLGFPPNCKHEKRSFCRDSLDCSDDKVCDRGKCLNPCSWMCSESSICKVTNHVMKCECPPNTEGDARFGCQKVVKPEQETNQNHPCKINCGPNTVCREVMFDDLEKYRNNLRKSRQEALYFDMIKANGNLQRGMFSECACRKYYYGNPYALGGCKPEVKIEEQEPVTIVMEPNPCDPSPCGRNSFCRSYQGKAFCSCDFDSKGQPPNCKHLCQADSHCMFNESCIRGICQASETFLTQ